jgi:hypothetical protein
MPACSRPTIRLQLAPSQVRAVWAEANALHLKPYRMLVEGSAGARATLRPAILAARRPIMTGGMARKPRPLLAPGPSGDVAGDVAARSTACDAANVLARLLSASDMSAIRCIGL